MDDLLEVLYKKYEILSAAKEKVAQHSKEYEECIDGVKGGGKEKKLAAQIISKFFKHFPDLQDTALNAILDLCEDGDSDIRICAMKVLPILCKDNKEFVSNISSILSQLLQLEDQDYTTACNSLTQVFKEDQIAATNGILQNVHTPGDEAIREKCITFLYKKLVKLQGKLSTELEDLLISEGKKILVDSTSTEFSTVMSFLSESKIVKTTAGQQELVDLVAERVELSENFNPLEEGTNNTDRLIQCVDCILPLFNANVESTKFVVYYCDQVLTRWDTIRSLRDNGEILQLRLLRQLAELSAHCGELEQATIHVEQIFKKIKEYMPQPPENVDLNELPNLDFTSVECLLYAFHKLARKCPEILTGNPEVLKDFRSRLQFFSRGVQGCRRSLDKTLKDKKEELTKEDKDKVKIAPAVFDNITSLIKDLFYQPPLYKCNVQLSFKKDEKKSIQMSEKSPLGTKRHVPITFESSNGTSNKQNRPQRSGEDRKLYQPPSGKFSNNFNNSYNRNRGGSSNRSRGNRGGSRGGWRN